MFKSHKLLLTLISAIANHRKKLSIRLRKLSNSPSTAKNYKKSIYKEHSIYSDFFLLKSL